MVENAEDEGREDGEDYVEEREGPGFGYYLAGEAIVEGELCGVSVLV